MKKGIARRPGGPSKGVLLFDFEPRHGKKENTVYEDGRVEFLGNEHPEGGHDEAYLNSNPD